MSKNMSFKRCFVWVEPELNDSRKFAAFYYLHFMLATFLKLTNRYKSSFNNG